MGFLKDSYRTLFGQTPVEIIGAFDFDETLERFNIVLSKSFYSQHLRHTVKGGQDSDGRLEFMYGYHNRHPGYGFGMVSGSGRSIPLPTPRLVGDLKIEDGLSVFRGHVRMLRADRIASTILLVVIGVGITSLFGFARSPSAVSTALAAGIIVPAAALFGLGAVLHERGEKLVEMLRWVMTEPLEQSSRGEAD